MGKAKGEAWFSDFKIEEGLADNSNEWNFACFIFKNTDVTIDNKEIKLEVTNQDVLDIERTINSFESTCRELSNGKMTAKCDTYIIEDPLTSLSYDDEFAYYVAAEDVENHIKETISKNKYDHIFVIVRLGDGNHTDDIQVNDWIGLRVNGLLWNWIFKHKTSK